MRSAALAIIVFLIPFGVYGNFVGRSVAKHLAQAAYSNTDVALGYWSFFVFAGLMAGLLALSLKKLASFDPRIRLQAVAAFLLPLVFGFLLADASLADYKSHPCDKPLDWLNSTAYCFLVYGLLPATPIFGLLLWRNKTINQLHESS